MTEEVQLFTRATDFSSVRSLEDAVASIGEDGNIGALLLQMAENDIVAVMLVDADYEGKPAVPFNPVVMGDEEFSYVPFFDAQDAYEDWVSEFAEENRARFAPIVMNGSVFFPMLLHGGELHTVLNPHLDTREIVYRDNLIWIRNKVNAFKDAPEGMGLADTNVVINMGVSLPDGGNQELLMTDLHMFLEKTPVQKAYFFVSDGFDKEKNVGMRGVQIFVELASGDLSEADAASMSERFDFDPIKYGLAKDYTCAFMAVASTDAGQALIAQVSPFYTSDFKPDDGGDGDGVFKKIGRLFSK